MRYNPCEGTYRTNPICKILGPSDRTQFSREFFEKGADATILLCQAFDFTHTDVDGVAIQTQIPA
jgi:hypothetical protein